VDLAKKGMHIMRRAVAVAKVVATGAVLTLAVHCGSAQSENPSGPGSGSSGGSGSNSGTGSATGSASGGSHSGSRGSNTAGSSGTASTSGSSSGNGSSSATGSSDGGADGGSVSLVSPTQVTGSSGDTEYRFTFGDVVFEVDPQFGARVDTLSLGGTNIVATRVADETQWGSTFWTSPRSDWQPMTWPPPASIDTNAYTGGLTANHLILTSATDPTMGFSIAKDYSVDATSGWINITYTINATTARKAAPWEDTRVPRGGLAFFPGTVLSQGPLTLTTTSGVVWFDDASMSVMSPSGAKPTGTSSEGWEAYATGGVLFLKKFAQLPASALAPMEGQVDVYPGMTFLEVEALGPYTSIPANGSLTWSDQWRVAKIPSSVTVSAGSATLVSFARQQAAM
jgi:hypothetical protein